MYVCVCVRVYMCVPKLVHVKAHSAPGTVWGRVINDGLASAILKGC